MTYQPPDGCLMMVILKWVTHETETYVHWCIYANSNNGVIGASLTSADSSPKMFSPHTWRLLSLPCNDHYPHWWLFKKHFKPTKETVHKGHAYLELKTRDLLFNSWKETVSSVKMQHRSCVFIHSLRWNNFWVCYERTRNRESSLKGQNVFVNRSFFNCSLRIL